MSSPTHYPFLLSNRKVVFVRGDFTSMALRAASFDGVVAFHVFNHVPREELVPTVQPVFGWLRPGGRLMLSLGAADTEDGIESDWRGVPMFFAGFRPETNERLSLETGFTLELSQIREEADGELVRFHWVIARRPKGYGRRGSG